MDKFLLKIIYFILVKVFRSKAVDPEQLKVIVYTKLLMDRRRVSFSWKQKKQQENSNKMLWLLFMYGLFGLMVGSFMLAVPDLMFGYIFFHSYILFMMAMTLITDFSSVMLDTTDTQIILPRPVSSTTLFTARMVHILIYILQFTIALGLIPLVVIFARSGALVGLTSMVTLLLSVMLAVFFTYLLYLLLMKITSEQKVREVITYFQIFMTIFFAIGYQIMPRLINMVSIQDSFHWQWYSWFLPPVWMSTTLDAIGNNQFDTIHTGMIALSVFIPIILLWVLVYKLAPDFAQKLAASGQDNTESNKPTLTHVPHKFSYSRYWATLVTRRATEQVGFLLTWKITGRDKGFKLKAYPSLAYIAIFIFIFVFNSGRDLATHWQEMPQTKSFLWFIYMPLFSVSGLLAFVSFSDTYNAAWVYYSTPFDKPGDLISGSIKALFIKFFVPVYLILLSFSLYVWGLAIIDDFIIGLINNTCLFLLSARLSPHFLPFSVEPNTRQQSGKFIFTLIQMLIISVLVGLHYLAIWFNQWALYVMVIPVVVGIYFLLRYFERLPWRRIEV